MKAHQKNRSERKRLPRRLPRGEVPPAHLSAAPAEALNALVKHSQATNSVLAALAKDKRGAFSSLGGDVDSMIEHGQQAYALVRKMLNAETKQYINTVNATLDYNWQVVDVTSGVTQGVGDGQRDGDSMKLNAIDFRCYLEASTTVGAICRLVVTISEDEAIAAGDAFGLNASVYSPTSYVAWDTRKQFRTIFDECYVLGGTTGGAGPWYVPVHIRVPLKNQHVQYSGGTTTVEKGAVQFWFVCNRATGGPQIYASTALEFADN